MADRVHVQGTIAHVVSALWKLLEQQDHAHRESVRLPDVDVMARACGSRRAR